MDKHNGGTRNRNNRHQRSLLCFEGHKIAMKAPKCSACRKKAEFYYQKDETAKKKYFCEDHGVEFMQRESASFLPRVEEP